MKNNIYFSSYPAHYFLGWEILLKNFVDKIRTHISGSIFFFKSCLYELWKNVTEPDKLDENMARVLHNGYLRLQTRSQNM